MAQRIVIIMQHDRGEKPVEDLARSWGVKAKSFKQTDFANTVRLAASLIDRNIKTHMTNLYSVDIGWDDAVSFVMNLRLLYPDTTIVAFKFSAAIEEQVKALDKASKTLHEIWYSANAAAPPQRRLAGMKPTFNVECKTGKIDLIAYMNVIKADLVALTEAGQRELQACVL